MISDRGSAAQQPLSKLLASGIAQRALGTALCGRSPSKREYGSMGILCSLRSPARAIDKDQEQAEYALRCYDGSRPGKDTRM